MLRGILRSGAFGQHLDFSGATRIAFDKSKREDGSLPGGLHIRGSCLSCAAACPLGIHRQSIPGSEWQKTSDPETASRAVKEYLATLDDAAFGAASEVTPKFISPSDPSAQWTGAMLGAGIFRLRQQLSS
jgi:hypothetical protein